MFDPYDFLKEVHDKNKVIMAIRVEDKVAHIYCTRPVAMVVPHMSTWKGFTIQYHKQNDYNRDLDLGHFVFLRDGSDLTKT